ncbi:MAG: DUF692 domain-containing protein [Gammaproteobacteria bacterium]|jgi:uncharacterized protein (UPF0276 family)|nr:DUF692 domain-containing protein [Gammaproteobacteria bacterium]
MLQGAGLGLRRSLLSDLLEQRPDTIDFVEVAPENWINVGGRYGERFREALQHYPLACHGLSLSIGSPAPLDTDYLAQLKAFFAAHQPVLYSEHLSYCSDDGHLYDLMPIPFTGEAVRYVAQRIRQVQDAIERPLIIENVSYYAAPGQEMTELEFLNAVLSEADCQLLLDINNIYVNSINHRYSAIEFMRSVPAERVAYFHVAGHYVEAEDLRIDTHAAPVCDPVWDLLGAAYAHFGCVPTLLERDFNIPPLAELLDEVERIRVLQAPYASAA